MVCAPFDYIRVDTYDDAIQALDEYGEDSKILAGGQSLGPMLALRLARPTVLVDINGIHAGQPTVDGDVLAMPALTRHREVVDSALIAEHVPMLGQCVSQVGNVRVRNRGTIGGSIAHADPTAEIACAALALDADVVVRSASGSRTVPARDFFVTYLTTVLDPSEVVTEVRFPVGRPGQGWSFQEMVRRASDFAIVAVAAVIELQPGGDTVRSADLALAGVADRPVAGDRSILSELVGSTCGRAEVARIARAVADTTSPESDVHASGTYRKHLVEVLTRRALTESFDRASRSAEVNG